MVLFRKYISLTLLFSASLFINVTINSCRADTAAPSANAAINDAQDKETFVKSITQSVLTTLHDHQKPFPEKKALLEQTFTNVVDINWIARFVLGKTWNTATDEQKKLYTSLYRAYLVKTYVANFDEDSENKLRDIKILGLKDADDNTFIVHTEMLLTDSDNVRVDYLVSDNNSRYKVIDITIEGVSLLATHRSQFNELATAGGINGVIDKLQQMAGNNQSAVAISMK